MKRIVWMVFAAALMVGFAGCGDDDPVKPKNDPPPSDYKDLSEDWHVLANLEQSYDDRNINRFAEIFDKDNFVFFFNPGDVGGTIPLMWGYEEEIVATRNMFTQQPGRANNPIRSIDLNLHLDDAMWVEVVDDPDFPGETLRQVTVTYDYMIDTTNDIQFITVGNPRAQFTVRNIDGKWKLVRWSDLDPVR